MSDRPLDYWELCQLEERERREASRLKTQEPLVLITVLFQRWSGATHEEILDQERVGELLPFDREKTILLPSGQKEHWLQPGSIRVESWDGETNITDVATVFLESNIREIEKKRPDFLCPMVSLENRPYLSAKKIEDPLAWYQSTLEGVRAELDKSKDLLAEAEASLASEKSENEKFRARVTELEKLTQNGAGGEEVKSLQWEVDKLRMLLEDEGKKSFGLSQELEAKVFELGLVRQELEGKQAGESLHIRTMWRYVLDLEKQGKTDDVIFAALKGDGFSGATANALLYDGQGANFEAVKKWGQRKEE